MAHQAGRPGDALPTSKLSVLLRALADADAEASKENAARPPPTPSVDEYEDEEDEEEEEEKRRAGRLRMRTCWSPWRSANSATNGSAARGLSCAATAASARAEAAAHGDMRSSGSAPGTSFVDDDAPAPPPLPLPVVNDRREETEDDN